MRGAIPPLIHGSLRLAKRQIYFYLESIICSSAYNGKAYAISEVMFNIPLICVSRPALGNFTQSLLKFSTALFSHWKCFTPAASTFFNKTSVFIALSCILYLSPNSVFLSNPKILCNEQKFFKFSSRKFSFFYSSPVTDVIVNTLHSNSIFACLTVKGNLSRK